ncbi:polysaccharide deacetylase family protein [Caldisericum sp.]|uniref:polysaccharide deacetylase family protein n=1 Tax=Caldisericum sp. TaxID=2499687 RepID=UPI003D14B298
MNSKIYFTTSWDDGSVYDLKLAEILVKYGIKGTFYIPIKNVERNDILSPQQIKELSELFEIGGHTYNHYVLTKLPNHIAKDEIGKGKEELENIIGKNILCFCFPKGKFRKIHIQMVKQSGFLFARTTGYLRYKRIVDKKFNLLHTTLQVYPHKPYQYILSLTKRKDIEGLKSLIFNFSAISNWNKFSDTLLRKAVNEGVAFHLWGHSWEIEELNLWGMLESFFKEVVLYKKNLIFVSNSELWKVL